jgi:CheY-like chemotaxis protein
MPPAVQTGFCTSVSNISIEKDDSLTKAVICECECTGSLPLPVPKEAILPRILVVDDDPMVCIAIEVCLRRQGMEVTIADGGDAGMRELASGAFDVMLVDIFMPHMRGFESIRIFHERAPDIPLVAMSGYAFANADTTSPDFLRMTLELGATRCLRKPFTPAALLAAVNDCLNKPKVNVHRQEN